MVSDCGTRWSYLFEMSQLCWQFNFSSTYCTANYHIREKEKRRKKNKEKKNQEMKLNKLKTIEIIMKMSPE